MKQVAEAFMYVGFIAAICWGLVLCEEIRKEENIETTKLYLDAGYKKDGWGIWVEQ